MNLNTSAIQIRHLQAFVITAEELHFTRAASRLHMAQQTLSQQIRQLEVELGLVLFDRSRRQIELTEAGSVFYEQCTGLLQTFEAAYRDAERAFSREAQTIFLAFTPSFSVQAADLRTAVLERHAGAKVSLVEAWTDQAIHGVKTGAYQGAIINASTETGSLATLEAPPTHMGLILGEQDPLAEKQVIQRHDLHDRTLVIWPRPLSPIMYESIVALFNDHFSRGMVHEFEDLSRGLLFDDPESRKMVAQGIAFMPAPISHVIPKDSPYVWRLLAEPNLVQAKLAFRGDLAYGPGPAWFHEVLGGDSEEMPTLPSN